MSFKKQRENISMYALFAFNQRHTDNAPNANSFIDCCAVWYLFLCLFFPLRDEIHSSSMTEDILNQSVRPWREKLCLSAVTTEIQSRFREQRKVSDSNCSIVSASPVNQN